MPSATRRPQAAEDILEIWDYIAEDSADAADRWLDRLDAQLQLMATQPLMGRARPELDADLRSLPIGRYVVFYAPTADGIDVVRVLHSARDIEGLFDDPA
jgi:toxin ParE1/3/4